MRTPKERLMHLLKLAAEGESARAQLVRELSEVLIDWPREYASTARLPFEALFERTLRETDAQTREALADTAARRHNAPITILNQLFFSASWETKTLILARNDVPPERTAGPADFDEDALIDAARRSGETFPLHFAKGVGLSRELADDVLRDETAQALAVVCKGARASRVTFSTLAVLTDQARAVEESYLRLASYDAVPAGAAERMLACWRSQEWATRTGSRNAAE